MREGDIVMTKRWTVAVAGGSLGGLTAALLLRDLGHDVTIYERSQRELEQRGAGIGFLPDSSRYLVERAGRSLEEISTTTEAIRYLDRSGTTVHEQQHRYRFSSWNTVYRGLLHEFDRSRYLLGHEVAGRDEHDDRVTVHLGSGRHIDADLLVCGVASSFRQQLVPGANHRYSGYVAWRGMVPESQVSSATASRLGDAITYYVYANSHVLMYPIPGLDGSVTTGERLLNFVWYRNYLDGADLRDVLRDDTGAQREISLPPGTARAEHVAELRATAAARLPGALAEVVLAVEEPFLQVVYDIEVDRLAFGRTCLIGDAGFVARPHAAAGTAKAAANAWALADAMAAHDDVRAALAAWEPGQLALGRQLVERTRRLGERSQFTSTWDPTDPDVLFRLREEGP
jgi:2,6-dihydroxypyridine 3-monooxygenase